MRLESVVDLLLVRHHISLNGITANLDTEVSIASNNDVLSVFLPRGGSRHCYPTRDSIDLRASHLFEFILSRNFDTNFNLFNAGIQQIITSH